MKNIKELRSLLGQAMQDLRDGKIDTNKAKVISDLGQVIVNSAKVEVDFIKAAKVKNATDFISDGIIKPLVEKSKPVQPHVEEKEDKPFERPKAEYTNKNYLAEN
jgi:hypothetical protein